MKTKSTPLYFHAAGPCCTLGQNVCLSVEYMVMFYSSIVDLLLLKSIQADEILACGWYIRSKPIRFNNYKMLIDFLPIKPLEFRSETVHPSLFLASILRIFQLFPGIYCPAIGHDVCGQSSIFFAATCNNIALPSQKKKLFFNFLLAISVIMPLVSF